MVHEHRHLAQRAQNSEWIGGSSLDARLLIPALVIIAALFAFEMLQKAGVESMTRGTEATYVSPAEVGLAQDPNHEHVYKMGWSDTGTPGFVCECGIFVRNVPV